MQPWEKTLNDAKIADVLTYIRQEWGNTGGPVAPEGIAALRKELAGHTASFKEADLKAVPEDANLPAARGRTPAEAGRALLRNRRPSLSDADSDLERELKLDR